MMARARIEYDLNPDRPVDMRNEPAGPLRQARLVLRVLLNQGDGTFSTTNAIADDLAAAVVGNLRTNGCLREGL